MNVLYLLGALLLALVLSKTLVPLMISLGHKWSLLDLPGRHKRHERPVPVLGGIALFATVWVTLLTYWLLVPGSVMESGREILFVFCGALIVVLIGLSDDLKPITAGVKLLGQVAAGLVVYFGGLHVTLLSTPFGSVEVGSFSVFISVLWVVGLTNAINLIDGLDGLAGGVSLIGIVFLIAVGLLLGFSEGIILLVAMAGFLVPFLWYNRYPARIFLGDSGSMQLGYYFAVFSLLAPVKTYTASALYLPLVALGLPLLEAGSSVFRRLISGRGVMRADRRHLFHYLSMAGFSPRQVVNTFYALALVFGSSALAMVFWNRLVVTVLLLVFMVVILVAFRIFVVSLCAPKRVHDRVSKHADNADMEDNG
ncbi:MAG: glycosyltransferase family 4 protein [Candidatus Zixiibacteriota bacterium]